MDVGSSGPTVCVLVPGVAVGGQVAAINSTWPLHSGTVISTRQGQFTFTAFNQDGFIGALVGDSQMRLGIAPDQRVELGREPVHPGLLLPDRNNQDNIRWCPGPRAARAREKGFTLDKSLTGRRQSAVEVDAAGVRVVPLHETCPTLLLTAVGAVTRLPGPASVRIGDAILVGTTVVAVRAASL